MAWYHGVVFLLEVLLLIPVTLASFLMEPLLESVEIMEHGVAKSLDVNVSSYHHYMYTVTQYAPIVIKLLSIVIMCPALPDIDNGMVEWSGLSPGGVATYTCDPDFILVGDATRICRDDGTWSGEEPTCERKLLSQLHVYCCTIIHLYFNSCIEVGCRDDTVPKAGDTRRYCEVVCNNLPQPSKNEM